MRLKHKLILRLTNSCAASGENLGDGNKTDWPPRTVGSLELIKEGGIVSLLLKGNWAFSRKGGLPTNPLGVRSCGTQVFSSPADAAPRPKGSRQLKPPGGAPGVENRTRKWLHHSSKFLIV